MVRAAQIGWGVIPATLWLAAVLSARPRWSLQEAAPPAQEEEIELRTAGVEELAGLMQEFSTATEVGLAAQLTEVLRKMHQFNNPELLEPAKAALLYEAGKLERETAKARAAELGRNSAKEIEALLQEAEALVRASAARLLANLPGPKAEALLIKALRDKADRNLRPRAFAAIVDALGRLDCLKVHDDIKDEFGQYRNREIMRACTRYFGQVQCKDKDVVRVLCEMLDPPQPAGVDDASNPPASYWEARWEQWNWIRRDIAWALKEITGQAFQPADGDKVGESKRALEWLRSNGKRVGIR